MSFTAKELLKIAAAEIGYKEKATNANLDDPTANAGDANYTKYARDLAAAGYYQASKQGFAWCDMFVDWCFLQLCGSKEKAEEMTCQSGPYGAGCEWSAKYYREQGRFFTENPQPGDQVFFENGAHTGIVEKVGGITITTIEGNTDNMVTRRTYSIGSKNIDGYGRPKYAVEKPVKTVEIGDVVEFTGNKHYISSNTGTGKSCKPGPAKVTAKDPAAVHPYHLVKVVGGGSTVYGWVDEEDVSELVSDPEQAPDLCELSVPTLHQGMKGQTVKALQILLIGNDFPCGRYGADGEFGADTKTALMMYQDESCLDVDGICGPKTWKKLLGI